MVIDINKVAVIAVRMARKNGGTPDAYEAAFREKLDETLRKYRKEVLRDAASVIEPFDRHVDHDWRLSDCLLAKFNALPKKKVRKNVRHQKAQ